MLGRSRSTSAQADDERRPLLEDQLQSKKPVPGPIPWGQFSIVLFLQLAEPLTSQVINPFGPQLIRDVGVTHGDETKVGYYVGMMQSIFFATQALTVMHWARLSDNIGRKPVILTGLFGLSLSMYCFGLSRTFWGLVFSRSLNGALNGNIGVIKSMMAELMNDNNLPLALGYMPLAWSTGGTLGPVVGGMLARPAERYPNVFGGSEFLKNYPYFLPCAVPATFTIIAWLVTLTFLKETVTTPVPLSRVLQFRKAKSNLPLQNVVGPNEPTSTEDPDPARAVSSSASSTKTAIELAEKPVGLRELMTPRVLVSAANYACLSLVDITFRAVQPVFFATPVSLGGLGLPPYKIGAILACFGIINGVFQIFWFAKIHDKWGTKNTYLVGVSSAILAFASFPVISALARSMGPEHIAVWVAVGFQIVVSIVISLSYSAVFIFISHAAPNRASLGATNGFCQLLVSIMRAVGPAAANSMFSMSINPDLHYLGGNMVYIVLEVLTIFSVWVGTLLPRKVWAVGE